MSYAITMLEGGYGTPPRFTSSKKTESQMKLGTAARQCKGKKKGAFRKCVAAKMRKGHSKRKHRRGRR